jgi:hypothetical protein
MIRDIEIPEVRKVVLAVAPKSQLRESNEELRRQQILYIEGT